MNRRSLFLSLVDMTPEQIDAAADGLHQGLPAVVKVDPEAYLIFTSTAPLQPFEVDVVCVEDLVFLDAVRMTLGEKARLEKWAARAVPKICQRWKERHPEN